MTPISRGFGGRRHDDVDPSRIPPGKYYERGFPVLSARPTPRTPLRRVPIRWHVATVRDARAESPTARSLVLDVPAWPGHRAGHHVDVRLTAEDGYQAPRSYSIASAPEHDAVEVWRR
jgi:hypothetical protein